MPPINLQVKSIWGGGGDSNSRLPAPKAGALPSALRPDIGDEI